MLLIATDEAGYGPKLGPLVVAATAWNLPDDLAWDVGSLGDDANLDELFLPLRQSCRCGDLSLAVADSKTVFKPATGLGMLHGVVSASLQWCERNEPTLLQTLPWLVPEDTASILATPWLKLSDDPAWLPPAATSSCLESWKRTGLQLLAVRARVITAREFNAACSGGANKADLLSETTLQLVRSLVEAYSHGSQPTVVFCDRHGGRRYYAGVLQHTFPDSWVQVVSESARQSVYRFVHEQTETTIRFTVKGDSFTPVALSSMHAKYLRERFMNAFNDFFAAHNRGVSFQRTAGYPVDADRFLEDITPIIEREKIDMSKLVRAR